MPPKKPRPYTLMTVTNKGIRAQEKGERGTTKGALFDQKNVPVL